MTADNRTATIRRDGETLATLPASEVLGWFHRNQSASMHHALAYEGYSVEYSDGYEMTSVRGRRDAYARHNSSVDPRPSRFTNDGDDYSAWAARADAWAEGQR